MKNELATEDRVMIPPDPPKQFDIFQQNAWGPLASKRIGSAISKLDPVDQHILWFAILSLNPRMAETESFEEFAKRFSSLHATWPQTAECNKFFDELKTRYL